MSEENVTQDRYQEGLATRRKVLGEDYVARALQNTTAFDAPFQRLITEAAWGHVWSSKTLSLRERSLITLALLAGLGNLEEFELHLRATARTGAKPEEIAAMLMHVAIYAGVPRANAAMRLAKKIVHEMEEGQ